MDKKKKLLTFGHCALLAGFVIMALACSDSDKEAFDRGWEYGRSLTSDACIDDLKADADTCYMTLPAYPDVADNTRTNNK